MKDTLVSKVSYDEVRQQVEQERQEKDTIRTERDELRSQLDVLRAELERATSLNDETPGMRMPKLDPQVLSSSPENHSHDLQDENSAPSYHTTTQEGESRAPFGQVQALPQAQGHAPLYDWSTDRAVEEDDDGWWS